MIAMTVMLMVKVTVDEIVDVIAMRNGGMTAAGPMTMRGVMGAAGVPLRARLRVRRTHRDGVFVDVAVMVVVQMPVVEIVDVIVVADREVSTVASVNVAVIRVRTMWSGHGGSFLERGEERGARVARPGDGATTQTMIVPSIHRWVEWRI
jgi:hypothetical protein